MNMQSRLSFSILSKVFVLVLFSTPSLFAQDSIVNGKSTAMAHSPGTAPNSFSFYAPNSFTPNGDGVNDTFTANVAGCTTFEMKIFDRWEHVIFTSNDINKAWDGRVNGGNQIAQGDTYMYEFKITDSQNQIHTYQGTVTLLR